MVRQVVQKIYQEGGVFVGGFVRDYLIRQEPFNDFDFYFESPPPWIQEWDFWGCAHRRKTAGKDFHCQKVPFDWDLSCNFFNFSKEKGLFAKPVTSVFPHSEAFDLVLKKEFAYLEPRAGNLRIKMLQRGWHSRVVNFGKRESAWAPLSGPWDAMQGVFRERFDRWVASHGSMPAVPCRP